MSIVKILLYGFTSIFCIMFIKRWINGKTYNFVPLHEWIASEPLNQANNVGAESQEGSLILSVENI